MQGLQNDSSGGEIGNHYFPEGVERVDWFVEGKTYGRAGREGVAGEVSNDGIGDRGG